MKIIHKHDSCEIKKQPVSFMLMIKTNEYNTYSLAYNNFSLLLSNTMLRQWTLYDLFTPHKKSEVFKSIPKLFQTLHYAQLQKFQHKLILAVPKVTFPIAVSFLIALERECSS